MNATLIIRGSIVCSISCEIRYGISHRDTPRDKGIETDSSHIKE